MSHYMTALAMKQKGLKPAAKIVLYWLADHHNGETGDCFPSLQRLAKVCEMDKATVARHLSDLEARGLISRTKRHRENGSQTSTLYTLHMAEPSRSEPVAERDTPCRKMQQTPVAKCGPHNLGRYNLGNEPISSPAKADDGFDAFWSIVPRKVGKAAALKAWRKACKQAEPQDIIEGMQRYARERDGQDQQYTAHPATWLNAGRWEDEAPPSPQDFHRKLDALLKEQPDGLPNPHEADDRAGQQLPKHVSAPDASARRYGAGGGARDSGGNQQPHLHLIRPKRFS